MTKSLLDTIHISRRRLLSFGAAAFALNVLGGAVPAFARTRTAIPDNLHFRALYRGKPVGEHKVTFQERGDSLVVITHVRIVVKVWFLTAFRYVHDAVEVWKSGQLVSIDSTTNDNGAHFTVSGRAVREGFRVSSADGPFLAASSLMTSNTIWNRRLMGETTMIDVQHGGVTGLVVKPLGKERIQISDRLVMAARFQIITPYYAGSLFFDSNGHLIRGVMEQQGEILEYVLNT